MNQGENIERQREASIAAASKVTLRRKDFKSDENYYEVLVQLGIPKGEHKTTMEVIFPSPSVTEVEVWFRGWLITSGETNAKTKSCI